MAVTMPRLRLGLAPLGHCRWRAARRRTAATRRRRATAGDRGEVSLQIVLLTPLVLLLVLVSVQAALWYHAAEVADSAAADGAAAAARYAAGTGTGTAAVAQFVAESGGRLVSASISADGTAMVATVAVHVPTVVPGWPDTVTRRASAPIERLTDR
jgi:Flp pilus assembly protein TadG